MKKLIYIIGFVLCCFGCGGNASDDINSEENPDENGNPNSPLMVNLQFPHEDGLCNLGANMTPTQSTVFFEWEASKIAESYTIYVTNLVDGTSIQESTTGSKIGVVINRATPYSWYVESTAGTKTEQSETWKFYNAGPGVETYAPFPATINAPTMAATVSGTNVMLQWTGSDVDNDIVGYDVYFGTSNNPNSHANNLTTNELSVAITSGTIYYWKIVTKDAIGNTSESGIFQFRVL